jgi:hypothetical protein
MYGPKITPVFADIVDSTEKCFVLVEPIDVKLISVDFFK